LSLLYIVEAKSFNFVLDLKLVRLEGEGESAVILSINKFIEWTPQYQSKKKRKLSN
jgi:hypothetical protein